MKSVPKKLKTRRKINAVQKLMKKTNKINLTTLLSGSDLVDIIRDVVDPANLPFFIAELLKESLYNYPGDEWDNTLGPLLGYLLWLKEDAIVIGENEQDINRATVVRNLLSATIY